LRRVFAPDRHDALVCGHIHRPGIGRIDVAGKTRTVHVVPEWDTMAGWVEWDDGAFSVVRRPDDAAPRVSGRPGPRPDILPPPMTRTIVIAMDGPAGSGKSTLARALAARLGYRYLDTGAMYRSVSLAASRAGIEATDAEGLTALLDRIDLRLEANPEGPRVLLDGEDVSEAIRTPEISRIVSAYASRPEVRAAMVRLQRAQRDGGGLVAEGRDIGTVVFPDAELKFYVTADIRERARRRLRDFGADESDEKRLQEVLDDIENRDSVDTGRADSPLTEADDAVTIDTTGLTVEQVLDVMRARVAEVAACSTGS